jgi:hypothetical protein
MKNWKNTFLSLIDSGAEQAKGLVESFNDVVNSFDWDAQIDYLKERRKAIVEKSNELFKDFTELLKQVKDSLTDFSVTVPFDESLGEKLSYEIVGNKLVVEVTYSDETTDRSNKTSVVIPSNCDLEKISHTVNTTLKTATITIPKVVIVDAPKEEATPTEKPKKKTVRKKPIPKAEINTEAEEKAADEPMTHISSKLVQKIQQNAEKARMLHRGANGRFVRRTVEQASED